MSVLGLFDGAESISSLLEFVRSARDPKLSPVSRIIRVGGGGFILLLLTVGFVAIVYDLAMGRASGNDFWRAVGKLPKVLLGFLGTIVVLGALVRFHRAVNDPRISKARMWFQVVSSTLWISAIVTFLMRLR